MAHVPEKKAEASYHPYVECTDEVCGFETNPSPLARDRAKDHVRYTGHNVRVVTEKVALWGPR